MSKIKFLLISTLLISTVLTQSISGQNTPIPVDKNIKIGVLPNGMKYYIRKNSMPEKRVELRLAVNSGSIQEDDNQRGLAHFVEHMCFNGTKNFPKNDLIHYLQSQGVNFGPEINASTSFDETIYMLTIPTDTQKVLDNGIQIMLDWASNVSFDSTEIDKERGILVEEWRIGRGADQRMIDKILPVLFKDSKYAVRLPIGTKESIENSKYDYIRKFYRDWYRPDLMSFIVVGDIDPDKIEAKIKNDFSKIKKVPNARKHEDYKVADNEKTIIAIAADKENPYNQLGVYYKTDVEVYTTINDYRRFVIYNLFAGMLTMRLQELTQSDNPPFLQAGAYYGNLLVRAKNGLQVDAYVSETGLERGLETILAENERLKKYGFTEDEFDRFKKITLKSLEQVYNELGKTESEKFADEYVRNFLSKEPIPGIEFEFKFAKENLQNIKLEEVNSLAKKWISDRNRVILVQGIDKPEIKLPDEKQIAAIADKVANSKIEPYAEVKIASSLIDKRPNEGSIINEKKLPNSGVTEVELSNGIKLILKPTDFKNDEILISAFRTGGRSVFPDNYHMSAMQAAECIKECGAGAFSKNGLEKFLAGKKVDVNPLIDDYYDGFACSSSKNDLETMMQLIYLYATQPRIDTAAYKSFLTKQVGIYQNAASDPFNYFYDQVLRMKYSNNPRLSSLLPTDADWKKVSYAQIMEIYKNRFSNVNGFVFVIVGSYNLDSIKYLAKTYLASLPSTNKPENWKDMGIRSISGPFEGKVFKGSDPKSYVSLSIAVPAKWNTTDEHLATALGNILERIYYDKLRESMSGVYNIAAGASLEKVPIEQLKLGIMIPCSPDNIDKLTNAALEEIDRIKAKGLTPDEINKEKEAEIRAFEKEQKDNAAWLTNLVTIYKNDEDETRVANTQKLVDLITSENIQNFVKKYVDTSKFIKVALYPENK